jgi:hypothetical protein
MVRVLVVASILLASVGAFAAYKTQQVKHYQTALAAEKASLQVAATANKRLAQDLSDLKAIQAEKAKAARKHQLFLKREAESLRARIKGLEDAKKELTAVELECFDSAIPDPILNQLRETTADPGRNERGSHQGVSKRVAVHRSDNARIRWIHLQRAGHIRRAVDLTYPRVSRSGEVSAKFLQ